MYGAFLAPRLFDSILDSYLDLPLSELVAARHVEVLREYGLVIIGVGSDYF